MPLKNLLIRINGILNLFFGNVNYKMEILVIFVFIEVVFFNSNSNLEIYFTLSFYLFLILLLFYNKKVSLLYLFSFSILTLGEGNYQDVNSRIYNFFGLRMFDISFQFFVILLFTLVFFVKSKFSFIRALKSEVNKFIFIYFIICLPIGLYNLIIGANFLDNFFVDIRYIIIIFIFIFLIDNLKKVELELLIDNSICATAFMILFSILFQKYINYSTDNFVLQNSLIPIYPFLTVISLLSKNVKKIIFNFAVLFVLLYQGLFLISGKFIVLIILVSIWAFIHSKEYKMKVSVLLVFIIVFINLDNLIEIFDTIGIRTYSNKLTQISTFLKNIINFNLINFANSDSSIGNIFAEIVSVYYELKKSIINIILGRGFGAGVSDYTGFLAPLAGNGGYSDISISRDNYFKMHLPMIEYVLKGGVFIFILYLKVLFTYFQNNSFYSLISFCLLFSVFTFTKESVLLTLIFTKITQFNLFKIENGYN